MEHLEWLLSLVANTAIIIFEFIGVGIIIYSGLTSFLKFLRRSPDTKIYLAKGLAMGLEFKMGSEILRTVVVREWKEIGIVAGIIALRAALTAAQQDRPAQSVTAKFARSRKTFQDVPVDEEDKNYCQGRFKDWLCLHRR